MFNYTYKNYLKFGYNSVPFSQRKSITDQFYVEIERCKVDLGFKESCLAACHAIRNDTNKELVLAFSGGIDSEFMVRTFLEANIDIKIAILDNGYNEHDIGYAYKFCKERNIPYQVYKVDVEKLFKSNKIKDFIKTSQVSSGTLLLHAYLILQIANAGGFPICGNGDQVIVRAIPGDFNSLRPAGREIMYKFDTHGGHQIDDWYVHFTEGPGYANTRFMLFNNIAGVYNYFSYMPEQIYSYLMRDEIINAFKDRMKFVLKGEEKYQIYSSYYTDLENREEYMGSEYIPNVIEYNNVVKGINVQMNNRYRYKYLDLLSLLRPTSESGG